VRLWMPCQDGRGHLVPNLSARSQPDLGDLGSISARLRSRRSISTVIPDLVSISTIHLGSISGDSHTSARARTTNISHPTHLPPHPTPSPPLAPSLSPAPWALLPGLCAAGRMGPREMRPRCGRDMAEIWPRCGRDDSSPLCFGAACSFHTPLHTPLHTHTLHPFPHLTLRLTPLHTSTPVRRRPRRGV